MRYLPQTEADVRAMLDTIGVASVAQLFSGVPSESAELEKLRPRTRLIEKPFSLVLLVETLEEMLAETTSQNLHPQG